MFETNLDIILGVIILVCIIGIAYATGTLREMKRTFKEVQDLFALYSRVVEKNHRLFELGREGSHQLYHQKMINFANVIKVHMCYGLPRNTMFDHEQFDEAYAYLQSIAFTDDEASNPDDVIDVEFEENVNHTTEEEWTEVLIDAGAKECQPVMPE